MVRLTKIYTKTGDSGETSIANNLRVSKTSFIINAIGAIDEANSAIGMIDVSDQMYGQDIIDKIQNDLFDLGASLAGAKSVTITENRIKWLESVIDNMNNSLEPLNSFILPTGQIHNARAIVRRAERTVLLAEEAYAELDKEIEINKNILIYLNRLSDLLFVMARYYNKGNEKLWKPMGEK